MELMETVLRHKWNFALPIVEIYVQFSKNLNSNYYISRFICGPMIPGRLIIIYNTKINQRIEVSNEKILRKKLVEQKNL